MNLVGPVLIGLLFVAIGWLLVKFSQYDSEAAAEDREAQDECEHRPAPEHDEHGILRCPACGKDLED